MGTSGRLWAATGGPGSGRANGGGPPSGDKGEPGDITMEERPESVLDTLDRRRDPPLAGRGGGWSNESRVIPRGLLLLPPLPRSLTPPGCASAAAAPLLLPSLAPLGVEVPPRAPPAGVLLGDGLQPPLAADRGNESAAAEEDEEEEARR
jgi:hypothetical protein